MVVVATFRAALRVAAIPHTNVHEVDRRLPYDGSGERMAGQELA
jgi:hypothetical protein